MRAMVLDAPGRRLRPAEVPAPEAGPGEVRIEVSWSGLRWAAALAALGIAACTNRTVLIAEDPNLPDGIVWRGVLLERADGTLESATGLVRREADQAIVFELGDKGADAEVVIVAGYSEAQLALASPPDDKMLGDTALARASLTDPLLPAPTFAARGTLEDGAVRLQPLTTPIELTAAWLPRCPTLAPQGAAVDVSCGARFCGASFAQHGCRGTLRTNLCVDGAMVEGDVDGRGRVAFEPTEMLGTCTSSQRPVEGTILSTVCEGGKVGSCRIDVYAQPYAEAFEVAPVRLFDVPQRAPERAGRPPNGYLGGVVVLDGQVAVATHAGRVDGSECTETASGAIALVDAQTLAVRDRVEAPPCLTHIVRDPAGDGFIGVFGVPGATALGRFDRHAQLVARTPIVDPRLSDRHFPFGIAIAEDPATVAVAFTRNVSPANSRIVRFDPGTLALTAISDDDIAKLRAIAAGRPGELVLLDERNDRVDVFDLESGRISSMEALPQAPDDISWRLGRIGMHGDNIVVSTADDNGAMHTLAPGIPRLHEYSMFYEWQAEPYAFVPWPADPRLLLVGANEVKGERLAAIALFEPWTPHFVPGAKQIGHGIVSEMVADDRGRVWATLTWSATLVRVSAK